MQKNFRVAIASLELKDKGGLFSVTNDTLAASWTPGTKKKRYGRTWQLSKAHTNGDIWTGRIGYVKEGEVSTLDWDPELLDFVEGAAPGGVTVPFAINTGTSLVAFQLRSGIVRPHTFTGALEALLSTGGTHSWSVRPIEFETNYSDWRTSVDKVTSFRFKLTPPNPHYADRPLVEELLEGFETDYLSLIGSSKDAEVDTESEAFDQAMKHVRAGYGEARLVGTRTDETEPEEFRMVNKVGSVQATARVEAETESDLIPIEHLLQAMSHLESRIEETQQVVDDDSG